jgi:hypothetical protein
MFSSFKYKDKPDLLPDAPKKNGFFLFWELYVRKFWRMVTVNLLYFAVTLPIVLYLCLVASTIVLSANGITVESASEVLPVGGYITVLASLMPQNVFIGLLIASVLLYGPATMGATYVYRNFAREEHAWVSDFFSRAWSNFRQGIIFGLLDVIVLFGLINTGFGSASGGELYTLSTVIRTFARIGIVFYLFIRHYNYLQAVTVELSAIRIVLNSFRFVLLGLWRNIIALAVYGGFTFIVFVVLYPYPFMTILLLPFVFYSFTGFATVVTVYPVIKKYIIDPAVAKDNASTDMEVD